MIFQTLTDGKNVEVLQSNSCGSSNTKISRWNQWLPHLQQNHLHTTILEILQQLPCQQHWVPNAPRSEDHSQTMPSSSEKGLGFSQNMGLPPSDCQSTEEALLVGSTRLVHVFWEPTWEQVETTMHNLNARATSLQSSTVAYWTSPSFLETCLTWWICVCIHVCLSVYVPKSVYIDI